MAMQSHRTIFDVPTAEEKQGTATSLYDGAEALQTRLYRPLAAVGNGAAGPTSGTNVSFSFESTDTLQWVPARTFLVCKLTAQDTGQAGNQLGSSRWVSLPLAHMFSQATLRLNSYTVENVQDPGMIAQFNARTMLKDAEKKEMLSCALYNDSDARVQDPDSMPATGTQVIQPLSLFFGLCSTEYSMPHARVEMDFTIAPDLLSRVLVGDGGAAANIATTTLAAAEWGIVCSFARPAVPQLPMNKTIVYEFPNQQFHSALVNDATQDVQLGVPASTYKLQVGFRQSGTGIDQDRCAFNHDWAINNGTDLHDAVGGAGFGYLSSVQAKLGSCTSPNAQFSLVGRTVADRLGSAKRPFFESQMANGVLTGAVDGEDFDMWNGTAIYSLPIVREPTSRDTAAVLQVRYGGHGPGTRTQAAIVVTGRSILTMKYGDLGEEATVEASNYV
jgi:hypothetical protein